MKKAIREIRENILLIVEDFDFIRTLVAKEFQKNNFTIISAGSIEDALVICQTNYPAIIFVDYDLRLRDPYSMISLLHASVPESYIVLVNGRIHHCSTEKAIEAGAKRTVDRLSPLSVFNEVIEIAKM